MDNLKETYLSGLSSVITKQLDFFHFFQTYLLDKYPPFGGEWQPFAAAILTNNLFKKYPGVTNDTFDLFSENETELSEILAVFSTHFKAIFTTYINTISGGLVPTAALFGAYTIGDEGEYNDDFNIDFFI